MYFMNAPLYLFQTRIERGAKSSFRSISAVKTQTLKKNLVPTSIEDGSNTSGFIFRGDASSEIFEVVEYDLDSRRQL